MRSLMGDPQGHMVTGVPTKREAGAGVLEEEAAEVEIGGKVPGVVGKTVKFLGTGSTGPPLPLSSVAVFVAQLVGLLIFSVCISSCN